MPLKLMYITNDPQIASIAQRNGVDRIWIDMEYKGKDERQKGIDSVKNHHSVQDIKNLRPIIRTSELLVRVNPWNDNYSYDEINSVIEAGADIIMLPMWKSLSDVQKFVRTVDGRAKTSLLLEHKDAVNCVDDVLKNGGFDEIHIGLNDLHLSYGLNFMFELLTNGIVESLCNKFKAAGVPYGFGGIAKIGEGDVPAEKIIMEHYRLGSTRVILSRSFCDYKKIKDINTISDIFDENMKYLRDFEDVVNNMTQKELCENKQDLESIVSLAVSKKKSKEEK